MQQHYADVNAVYQEGVEITPEQDRILDLVEQEQANSLITANTIENDILPEEDTAKSFCRFMQSMERGCIFA